jgi:DNA repair exonuclease SbcCD ATPase subunit
MVEDAELSEKTPNVALFHQAVKGAMQGEAPFPSEIPSKIFDRFDAAFGGHVHHKQRVGNVQFLGSVYNLDFREANEVQGYHLLDTETLDVEFVSSRMPRFRIFEGETRKFSKDDYVIVRDPEEKPRGRARLLIGKDTEKESEARRRLDLDMDRFTWEDAIAEYVKATAPKDLDALKLVELGVRLLGDSASRAGSVPGIVTFREVKAKNFEGFVKLGPLALDSSGVSLIIGRNRDTTAATSNGSGKSTIFNLILWILYGKTLDGSSVIRIGEKKAEGVLFLEKNGDEYEVERTTTERRGTLSLKMNGETISSEGSKAGTQSNIDRLLGLDFVSFRNSVIFGQGDRMRFADPHLKDEQRKKIFRSALDIDDAIKAAQKRASSFKAKRQAELDKAQGEASRSEEWIERLNVSIDDFTRESNSFEEERASKVKRLEASVEDLEDRGELIRKAKRLRKLRDEKLETASGSEDLDGSISKTETEMFEIRERIRKVERKEARIEAEIGSKERELARFDEGKCPTCGTKTSSKSVKKHTSSIKDEIDALRPEASKATKDIGKLKKDLSRADEARLALTSKRDSSRIAISEANKLDGSLKALALKVKHLDGEAERIESDIGELKRMSNPFTGKLESSRADLLREEGTLETARAHEKKALAGVHYLDYWVRGYGNKGIAGFLVELYLPRLERGANKYLEILADGDLKLELAATKETKRGTEEEALSIIYTIEGTRGARPSGGQIKRIEIANELAFGDLLGERDGAEIAFMGIDEILDGLDAEGRARVMVLIEELRRRKGAVMIISHDAELSSSVDRTLLVLRKGGKAQVSEV